MSKKIRPTCENCEYEIEGKRCAPMIVGSSEFDINPKAKRLVMDTPLTGFCEYHKPRKDFEDKIDYEIKPGDEGEWQT